MNEKLNIAFYSITPLRHLKEATTITILSLARELKNKGHKVVVITEKSKNLPKYQEIEGIPIYRHYKLPLLSKIISHPLTLRKIQKKSKIKFNIIHSFSATPLFVLTNFISKLFCPKAKTIHTLKSYSRNKFSPYFFFLLNLVDCVTVPTQVFAKKLITIKNKKIKVVHSPINLERFYPKNKEELKKKYGYENKTIIFYYGSLHEHKGVDNLINAIPYFKDNLKDDFKNQNNLKNKKTSKELLFLFAPRYKDIEKEIKLIKKLDVEELTEFVFDIPIEDYINMSEVVVLPYNNLIATEGNPSCILESIACKVPVITADLPELREIVENEEEVLMINVKNNQEIINRIQTIFTNKTLIEKLKNRGFEKSKEFGIKKIGEEIIGLYKN